MESTKLEEAIIVAATITTNVDSNNTAEALTSTEDTPNKPIELTGTARANPGTISNWVIN